MRSVLLAAAVLLSITACGGQPTPAAPPSPSPAAPLILTGRLVLSLGGFAWSEEDRVCWGINGHEDIQPTTQVVVSDSGGATIAVGELGSGSVDTTEVDGEERAEACYFTWTIPDVPPGKGFYGVEVGDRGRLQYEEARVTEFMEVELN